MAEQDPSRSRAAAASPHGGASSGEPGMGPSAMVSQWVDPTRKGDRGEHSGVDFTDSHETGEAVHDAGGPAAETRTPARNSTGLG